MKSTSAQESPVDGAELIAISKFLSKVLRHEPELVRVRIDAQGWVSIDELIDAIARAARAPNAAKRLRTLPPVNRASVEAVVASNDKQRFAVSPDGARIRAVQGHSIDVALGHPVSEPPELLFHGTAAANWDSIAAKGLHRGQRHAVHLSLNAATAMSVGARHGRPLVLEVAAAQMHRDGFVFTLAENAVWLVESVPSKYLKRLG